MNEKTILITIIFRFFEIKLYNNTHGNYSDEKYISR